MARGQYSKSTYTQTDGSWMHFTCSRHVLDLNKTVCRLCDAQADLEILSGKGNAGLTDANLINDQGK